MHIIYNVCQTLFFIQINSFNKYDKCISYLHRFHFTDKDSKPPEVKRLSQSYIAIGSRARFQIKLGSRFHQLIHYVTVPVGGVQLVY